MTKEKAQTKKAVKPITRNLLTKIIDKLVDQGISFVKAKELAPKLVPTVRAAVKAELKEKGFAVAPITAVAVETPGTHPNKPVTPTVAEEPKQTPSNTPYLPCNTVAGAKPGDIQNGRCSIGTYQVLASKGDSGVLSARKFSDGTYKTKFFPSIEFWGVGAFLEELGASTYTRAEYNYQGTVISEEKLAKLISYLVELAPTGKAAKKERYLTAIWRAAKAKFPTGY